MGNVFASEANQIRTEPEYLGTPEFDPLDGFPRGRKPRGSYAVFNLQIIDIVI